MIPSPVHRWRSVAAVAAAACLAACASLSPRPDAISAQRAAEIVASPDRTAADQTNDARRKPAQLLAFIGVRPGITALDIASGGGYTTELLARAIGPGGTVYGQRPAPREGAPVPPRGPATALLDRADRLRAQGVAAAAIVPAIQPFADPVPAAVADGRLDLVTFMFNYHDMGHLGVDRAALNRAVFRALKPGGLYVIADHSGRAGTGISESGTLHRIEEAFLRQEIEAAGFRAVAEGGFLRNPNDPRDRDTPQPAQPKDEFVLKFVKP